MSFLFTFPEMLLISATSKMQLDDPDPVVEIATPEPRPTPTGPRNSGKRRAPDAAEASVRHILSFYSLIVATDWIL